MELSHLITKSITVSVVTLLTLCLAIGVQTQSQDPTAGVLVTELTDTDVPATAFSTDAMTTSPAADMTTETQQMTTAQKPTTKPMPPGTTGKTEPSGTTPGGPTPIKGHFKWATFFCIIILIACLIGIGFCAYQFYRKRQTDSYHTL